MDVENITNYRRRVLSVSVRLVSDGVAEFAVTGLAFLWHQARFVFFFLFDGCKPVAPRGL